jgi:hypothetical protein
MAALIAISHALMSTNKTRMNCGLMNVDIYASLSFIMFFFVTFVDLTGVS